MSESNDQEWDATRRGFLGVAAGLTGAMLLRPSSAGAAAGPAASRSFISSSFVLELDGILIGLLRSVDGGDASADVVAESESPACFTKKTIGPVKYEDFEVQAGFSLNKEFYDWIARTWTCEHPRHDGSVTALDFKMQPRGTRAFFDALITEVGIPACDGSSKEPAYLTVKFSSDVTTPGKPPAGGFGGGKHTQKLWLPSNFRLKIDGLDCSRVNKIDSFTVKQTVIDDVGESRDFMKVPGKLEFPNLSITLAESTVATWQAWFDDFVIKGNAGDDKERTGTLEFLSPNRVDTLATITFFNLGIFKLAPEKAEANADTIRRVKAELYCERMEFSLGEPSTGG